LAGEGCNGLSKLVNQYREIIEKQIGLSQENLKASSFLNARENIDETSSKLENELNKLLENTNKASDIDAAKIEIRKAIEEFNKMKDKVEILSGKNFDNSFIIDTKGIDTIGNPGEVLSFMASRLNEVNTYIYLFIALLIDITLISSFKAVIEIEPRPGRIKVSTGNETYM
jgi:hypothetical protein